jgi:hypothetical protein
MGTVLSPRSDVFCGWAICVLPAWHLFPTPHMSSECHSIPILLSQAFPIILFGGVPLQCPPPLVECPSHISLPEFSFYSSPFFLSFRLPLGMDIIVGNKFCNALTQMNASSLLQHIDTCSVYMDVEPPLFPAISSILGEHQSLSHF